MTHAPRALPWGAFACILLALGWCASAGGQPDPGGQYQVYELRHKAAADVEKMLAEMLSGMEPSPHVVADVRHNRILLRGSEKAQHIARQLIDSIDQPPVQQAPAKPVIEGYRCPKDRLAETAGRIRAVCADRRDVRIVTDTATSQVLVLAPPEVHAVLVRRLAEVGIQTQGNDARLKSLTEMVPDEQFVGLLHGRAELIEQQLRRLLGSRLEPLPARGPRQPDYLFADAAQRRVELSVDRQRNGILLVGNRPLVRQFAQLCRALDALENPRREPGRSVQIVPVRRADPTKVRKAVEAYRSGGGANRKQGRLRRPNATGPRRIGRYTPFRPGSVRLAQFAAPLEDFGAEPGPRSAVETIPATEEEAAELEGAPEQLRQLGERVEIETLEDLDVIILRGPERDLDEVSRIIAEIERLSEITEPIIDIYMLQHVSGEAMIEIIDLVAEDLAGGRQGSVRITPLVKPNALLLIGWGEALKAVKELIARLDRPVPPRTQLRVFPLRNAAAETAASTVEDFFEGRGGLGPQVQVEPDARTNSLIVRAAPRDMAEVALLIDGLDRHDSDAVMRTRVYKLRYSLASDLATTLRTAITAAAGGTPGRKSAVLEFLTADPKGARLLKSGILSDVEITPDPHTNTLIVSAPAESMDLLLALIEQLDSPTGVAQIKVFPMINGDANSMVEMLRTLLPAQLGAAGPQLAGAEGETTLVPVRFSVDARTNSIIATGSEKDLEIIEALILRLDGVDVEKRVNQVYRLRNAPAAAVAESVNEFLQSERVVLQAAPGAESPFLQIEREVVVVPEIVSNSLIISATPRFIEEIMTLVEDLDKAPDQVMIQVVIAEVELNNVDEFGVELGLQDSVLFDRSLIGDLITTTRTLQQSTEQGIVTVTEDVIVAASNDPGFNFNTGTLPNSASDKAFARSGTVAGQGLTNFAVGRMNNELGYGGLVLSASSESVSVMIRALQETRRLDVLGRPQIQTLDNQPAFIQVGKLVPRISGSRFDGRVQVNQIEMEPTGLILGVTPRISPEGMVVMEIDAEKSEVLPEQEGIPVSVTEGTVIRSPAISITLAQTTVSAASGETIVLGGLISKNSSSIQRRVPWLSRVPVLGNLFRYDSQEDRRSELLIFLTPHVVTSAEEAERIKQIEAARMSWCLADVYEIHGPLGVYDDRDSSAWHGEGEVVYPDTNPRGQTPGEFEPKEVAPSDLPLSPPIDQIPTPAPKTNQQQVPSAGARDSRPPEVAPGGAAPQGSLPAIPGPNQPLPKEDQTPQVAPTDSTGPMGPEFGQPPVPADVSIRLNPADPGSSYQASQTSPMRWTEPQAAQPLRLSSQQPPEQTARRPWNGQQETEAVVRRLSRGDARYVH